MKAIIDEPCNNGFDYYIRGRSYDLEENYQTKNPELAVKNYKIGYYKYKNKLCQYSIAISIMLGEFIELFDDEDKNVSFPTLCEIEELSKGNSNLSIYAKFVLAAYYNYGLAGTPKDENKAFKIIKECAERGHVGAMFDLGAKEKFSSKIGDELSQYFLSFASENGSLRATQLISENKKIR